MKSPKIKFLFVACVLAMSFTALAFLNNLVAIINWWRAFLAAGGDSSSFTAKAPGFIPWLDWSVVDYSAVTTFIPFLGCLCLTIALAKLMCGRRVNSADFPFFRGSDQLNVALGLFGTLWGIIVIGYFKLDTVSMADLMQCLHTALFSTLSAVVWVFMIDRPLIRPACLKLLARTNLAETDDGDLVGSVSRLVERLGAASDAFDARQAKYEKAFADRLASFEAAAAMRSEEAEKAFREQQTAFELAFATRLKDCATETDNRLADIASAFDARQKAYDASFEKRLADYQTAFETRQKEYRELFLRRIAELEKAAAEERARADRMAAKLGAVAEALR